MSNPTLRGQAERDEICREIEALIRPLPETNEKGKLRGLLIRLRIAAHDEGAFEAELRKLAALTEEIRDAQPASRLLQGVERRLHRR